MTDRECLYYCESCGKPIYEGDMYQPGGECDFCPEHAATLTDIVDFWERDIADVEHPCWPDVFDSIEDAQAHVESLREQIARDGADFKPTCEA